MAIDSSLFMAQIPAGSYSAGDVVPLTIKAGPSVVRSGRGAAVLKRVTVGIIGDTSGAMSYWRIKIKNSDWIDDMISATAPLFTPTSLDERSGCVQRGNDCPLTPNSSWVVEAVAIVSVTTTTPNDMFAIIDIDYPSVSSIVDPDALPGIPTTIPYTAAAAITVNAGGTSGSATWDVFNVDILKAGYEYALQKIEVVGINAAGFIALTNAANMAGLCRIIPASDLIQAIRNKIEYATKLVKGPMDIQFLMFANGGTASTATPTILLDFVKRRV